MWEVIIIFLIYLPTRDRTPHILCHFWGGNTIIKISCSFRDNKSGIYLFNRSSEINFGNGSLSPAIRL